MISRGTDTSVFLECSKLGAEECDVQREYNFGRNRVSLEIQVIVRYDGGVNYPRVICPGMSKQRAQTFVEQSVRD